MTRFALVFGIVISCALAVTIALGGNARDNQVWLNADSPYREKIGEMVVSYRCFKSTFNTTVGLLVGGEITLADACERIRESALANHPDYLKNIEVSDPAPTVTTRIARNLLGHLQSDQEGAGAQPSARLQTLELELATLQ